MAESSHSHELVGSNHGSLTAEINAWIDGLALASDIRERARPYWEPVLKERSVILESPHGRRMAVPFEKCLTADEVQRGNIKYFLKVGHEDDVRRAMENESAAAREREVEQGRQMAIRGAVFDLEIAEAARVAFRTKNMTTTMPNIVGLADFLGQRQDVTSFTIGELWPAKGRVVLTAQQKGGKTTMVQNLIKALADATDFLGSFEVSEPKRVILIDNEMSPALLQDWFQRREIVNLANVTVIPIRGLLTSFNILDVDVRAEWGERLRSIGADVLIFDCLRPVLDALGLDENRDAGKFLTAFSELCGIAEIDDSMIVHHMGHGAERGRGDSSIPGWADANWFIVREDATDDASPRFFRAYGRDVEQQETRLTFDRRTNGLTLDRDAGSRKQARVSDAMQAVIEFVALNPGCSGRAIEAGLVGSVNRNHIRGALQRAVAAEKIATRSGPRRSTLHYAVEPETTPEVADDRGPRQLDWGALRPIPDAEAHSFIVQGVGA